MDESKRGETGWIVPEGQTVSFYESVPPVENVDGEAWGPKRG